MCQTVHKAVKFLKELVSRFLSACIFLLRITVQSKPNRLNLVWKQNLELLILAVNTLGLVLCVFNWFVQEAHSCQC